jgi:8-oxo-dGTP pyrophosphatase MutT (NUDIX family)
MNLTLQTRPPTLLDTAWQTIYRLGFPLARLCWRLCRARHEGAIVAVYVDQSLLLLRSSYRRGWSFPGGTVGRGETPEEAARRELAEETGIKTARLSAAGSVRGVWDGRRDHAHVFELRLDRLPELKFDNREIIGAQLMPIRDLASVEVTGEVAAFLRQTAVSGTATSPME